MTTARALILSFGTALLAGGLTAPPALAQPRNEQALVVFGSDPCPRDTICVRAPESERFRIPKGLRDSTPSTAPGAQAWSGRAKTMEYAGASGTASCSASGAGGWTGCVKEMNKAAKAERKQAETGAANDRALPPQ